ncbi:MAG: hypothetical protein AB7N73_06810 [Gemmatimonadales bacterium]
MMSTQSEAVVESLEYLEREEDRIRDAALAMLEAAEGALYPVDLVAIAALNRALDQSAAFRLLVSNRHFPSAAILLRTQLDSALRFSALWHVADPGQLARAIIKGEHVRRHKDRMGQLLTDARLVELQSGDRDWLREVYDKASGFVHLSSAHLAHAFAGPPGEDGRMPFKIGIGDEDLGDQVYLEAIAAFDAATDLLVELVENWTVLKATGGRTPMGGQPIGSAGAPHDVIRRRAT